MTKIRFVLICLLFCLLFPAHLANGAVGNVISKEIISQDITLNQKNGDRQVQKKNEMIKRLIDKDLIISPIKSLDNEKQDSTLCLAMNIYNEARNSSLDDMIGVSLTVFSRLNHGRYVNANATNNVCNVVFADKQYSWTNHNISLPKEKSAWVRSQTIAFLMITDTNFLNKTKLVKIKHYVLTSLYRSETDKWFNKAQFTKTIGAHTYLLFTADNANTQSEIVMNIISDIKGRLSRKG